jgi:hypothetical protein
VAALYLDEDVHYAVTRLLADLGHGVVHARDHAKGAKDDVQLLIAARERWTLITCNRKDFVLLQDAWQHWSQAWGVRPEHAGILVVHNDWPPPLIAERVHAFFAIERPTASRLYRWIGQRGWEEVPTATLER